MILPIYTILSKMDQDLIMQTKDLGANSRQVFRRVVLPLSMPGVSILRNNNGIYASSIYLRNFKITRWWTIHVNW